MTTDIGLARAASNTSIGVQSFRDANMSETPNAAMIIVTSATADGTLTATANMSIGVTDGTNHQVMGFRAADNVGTTDTDRTTSASAVIKMFGVSGSAIDFEASFSQWLSDSGSGAGIEINITNAPSSAFLVTVYLFNATSVQVGQYDTQTSNGTTRTISTSFAFDLGFFINSSTFIPDSGLFVTASVGVADTYMNQGMISYFDRPSEGTSDTAMGSSNNRIAGQPLGSSYSWANELTAITSSNFEITQHIGGGGTDDVAYMILEFADRDTWVGDIDFPNATGSEDQTGAGIQPDMAGVLLSGAESYSAISTTGNANVGLSAFTANDAYCNAVMSDSAVGTSDTNSISDDVAVNLPDEIGATESIATFTEFLSNGWRWNVTSAPASVKKAIGWAVSDIITTQEVEILII